MADIDDRSDWRAWAAWRDRGDRRDRGFPRYGPIDALLGLAMFVVFLERATPAVVDVLTTALDGLSTGAVRTALAAFIWFVLAVTLLDQLRKQYEGLRELDESPASDGRDESTASALVPSTNRLGGSLVVAVVGGLIAAWTFERAVATGIALIRLVATPDVWLFDLVDVVLLVVFFLAYGAATRSIDRLLVGGLRRAMATSSAR